MYNQKRNTDIHYQPYPNETLENLKASVEIAFFLCFPIWPIAIAAKIAYNLVEDSISRMIYVRQIRCFRIHKTVENI